MTLPLTSLVDALEEIAPLSLAEAWDNVGLLVDPRARDHELPVERVLMTINATPEVLREARDLKVECLLAYHPPIFRPLKRMERSRQQGLFEAISAGLAVYSPHTALDAAPGGLNDWLAEAFGEAEVVPLVQASRVDLESEFKLVVFVPKQNCEALREALAKAGAGTIGDYSQCSFLLDGEGTFFGEESANPVIGQAGRLERVSEVRLEMVLPKRNLGAVAKAIEHHHPYQEPAWDLYPLAKKPISGAGSGRCVTLGSPRPLDQLVERVKWHLGVRKLRLATTDAHFRGAMIRRIAISAGSGASLFDSALDADLYLTGELGHHDLLRALENGTSVMLCEHSNTERGYLPRLRDRLLNLTQDQVEVFLARSDREPIQIA